jgi:DNA adenine methylase
VRAAAPIVKWVGGKTKLLPELLARKPAKFNRYFEPFLGGAAMFFALKPNDAVLGDMNAALIGMYQAVANDVEQIIGMLGVHRNAHHRPKYYYEIRDIWNEGGWIDDPSARASAFIYLNKTCFNGLWRVNRKGEFNVPRGDYENPTVFDPDALRAASVALHKANLRKTAYDQTTASATAGDFVYFDPPYDPHSKTSNFTAYTKDAFGKDQQLQLATHARELRKRGCYVMLSNNDTAYVRSLYEDFCIDTVQCGRSVNSKGDKRGKVNEVIITSYGATS